MRQRTIKDKVRIEGIGIHTGERTRITLHPADENTGVRFLRKGVYIPASPEHVVGTFLSTDLGCGSVTVKTVEHLLATLHLLRITNTVIEVEGGCEIPIMDGSAYAFYSELKGLVVDQTEETEPFSVADKIRVSSGKASIEAEPCPCFEITYEGAFKGCLGEQRFTFRGNAEDVILARTFCFDEDIEFIRSKGLGRGGSLDNTLVIGRNGVYNREGLRYENEPARHKVLDLIGDLYLLGAPFRGRVVSRGGGHTLNYMFVKKIHRASKLGLGSLRG
ncbi:MAG: UDP-3-O-acyl-N-acetylglucosamine deacetylase [Aquificota bacterium]|nr:UDP-3-O-acyl-N-acetylglucosamine deacetylase [Aquificota bacterium]